MCTRPPSADTGITPRPAPGLMRALVHLAAGVLMMSQLHAAEAPSTAATYAEKLGWPAGTRAVIFHVDDVGMSHESNVGARVAIEDGLATSGSIMMPCPWVPEVAAAVGSSQTHDLGLHLTLTSEWQFYRWGPVAGAAAVPGLADTQGCLHRTADAVATHASPTEVAAEIAAQIAKARLMGLNPTHLDSHMGVCFLPPFFEAYVRAGIENGIPVLIFAGHMQHIGRRAAEHRDQLRQAAEAVWAAGLPVIDDLVTSPTQGATYEDRRRQLADLLTNLQPGITQIILHCTAPSDTFGMISSSGPSRVAEMKLMTDPVIAAVVEKQGIVLTTWRELLKRRQAAPR